MSEGNVQAAAEQWGEEKFISINAPRQRLRYGYGK
jgi:hypothetical protein